MPAPGPSEPLVQLTVYRYGLVLKQWLNPDTVVEYPISPDDFRAKFVVEKARPPQPTRLATGLINAQTLYVAQAGATQVLAEYREPQVTGFWFDGSPEPVRAPLPGLILVRTRRGTNNVNYALYAVPDRPTTLDAPLYEPPLPNIHQGGICWGTARHQPETGDYALTKAWEVFFATPFNNHHVDGKSRRRKYRADVRKLLLDLEKQQARKYPVKDLVKLNLKLGPALGEYPPKKSR